MSHTQLVRHMTTSTNMPQNATKQSLENVNIIESQSQSDKLDLAMLLQEKI